MPTSFWYWLILVAMVVCVLLFGYTPGPTPYPWYRRFAWHFWLFVLLVIIGYHDFGSPLDALVRR